MSFVLMNSSSKLCLPGFSAPRPLLVSSLKAVQKPSQEPPPHYPPREHVGKGCIPILFVGCPATIWLQMTAKSDVAAKTQRTCKAYAVMSVAFPFVLVAILGSE